MDPSFLPAFAICIVVKLDHLIAHQKNFFDRIHIILLFFLLILLFFFKLIAKLLVT